MKSTLTPYWAQLISLSLVATFAAGCSKKKSDDSDGGPNPDTEITAVEAADDGKTVTVMYKDKNDNTDVSFKCQVEQTQAEKGAAPEWTDCDAAGLIVDVSPQARYTFRVKAIAGGVEDMSPASRVYVAKGQAAQEPADAQQVAALILNKGDVGATYTKDSLTLNLGVAGQVNLDDIRFEYKLNGGQWTRVAEAETLKMSDLEDGKTYELAVRAVHRPTNSIGGEDTMTFTVKLAGALSVTATPDLTATKTGTSQLSLAASGGDIASMTCALDGAQDGDCKDYVPSLNLDQVAAGAHRLVIQAADANGKSLGSSTVNFCAQSCTSASQPIVAQPQIMSLGDFYSLKIPEGMHVTEYSSTKNFTGGTTGQLQFYRIRTNSDPFYIGNYKCDGNFDTIVPSSSPRGQVYDYCYSTFPRTNADEFYKWLTSYGLANNHIEVATDADKITNEEHERIVLNVFDRDYEFMHGRSRFEQLCMNARGEIVQTPNIAWIDNFWTERVRARMVICKVTFANSIAGNGLPTLDPEIWRNVWWVGAFFIDSTGEDLPRNECFWNDWQSDLKHGNPVDYHPEFCGNFKNPSLLEVTYISKTPYPSAEWFAQEAQMRIRPILKELTPVFH